MERKFFSPINAEIARSTRCEGCKIIPPQSTVSDKDIRFEETLLFERTFEIIKIALYSSAYLTSVLRYLDLFDM